MLNLLETLRLHRSQLSTSVALATVFAANPVLADVFISEFHYDNASSDVDERIEISADLATDLSNWSVVLYNGSNGSVYNTLSLGAVTADASCGAAGGTYVINLPANGLQNGSPDGIALIDGTGAVAEFLSYEGDFVAVGGAADGVISTNVGVAETGSTPAGHSLKLENGTWTAPSENTFGTCDTEVESDGTPTPTPSPTPTPIPTPTPTPSSDLSISEIHYDNDGADEGEGIELTAPAGTDLSGWSVVLYNGNGAAPYNTQSLSGSMPSVEGCDAGYLYLPVSGIQNGAPDGVALVDASGSVVEFLSYEGAMTGASGPATGIESTDIGVAETSATPVGYSLQKIDGTWVEPAANTFGSCAADDAEPTEPSLVRIHDIQGGGEDVAISELSTVSAIVTAVLQDDIQAKGFFIQEEDADVDGDVSTSEGIFVFCDTCPVPVAAGDLVEVTGVPTDFFGMSQISARFAEDINIVSSNNPLPTPASIDLPVIGDIDMHYEAVEGMLVNFVDTLSVAEYFQLGRYGEVLLAEGGRPRQFTDQHAPDAAGYAQHMEAFAGRTITLDDIYDGQNTSLFNDLPVYFPAPGLSADNYFRGGDQIESLTGVLQYSFSKWRVRPSAAFDINFVAANPRTDTPADVGGTLKVASFNVLNYFTTLNENGSGCGPDGTMECRGAHSADELLRQTQKIVSAMCAIDADIVGLMEIENAAPSATVTPIEALVEAINAECGAYVAIETGTVGTDAISVGFIYKPETVIPVGITAILDDVSFTDPNNTGVNKNRPAIAQSFEDIASGSALTVAVNHLKSKGSSCGTGDDSRETGQGNCNGTRTLAAEAEAAWLASNPTGVDSDMVLVIGDLNAYRMEDPITAFKDAGYSDLVDTMTGESAYGYVFGGQLGYLDYALANDALFPYVTGVTDWHINADEINLLDYNDTVRDAEERSHEVKPSATELFAPDAYRSSDHDPVVVGIALPVTLSTGKLIERFHEGLNADEIRGVGGHWFWRYVNRYVFGSYLYHAKRADDAGKIHQACRALTKADRKSDELGRDLITGPAVSALNLMIKDVKASLGCG